MAGDGDDFRNYRITKNRKTGSCGICRIHRKTVFRRKREGVKMEKIKNRGLAVLLTVAMVLSLSSGVAFAENGDTVLKGDTVATIGTHEYTSLEEAIEEATNDDTVVLQQNVEVDEQIPVMQAITLNLNGNTIMNKVEKERLFAVTASSFTVNGTAEGSAMMIPESNTESYGFIKVAAASAVTLNGGTYSGNTNDGAFVKIFNEDDDINASGPTVILNNVEMTSNYRFFSTDTLTTLAETTTLQVTGGTYTTEGQAFSVDVANASPVSFSGVTVTAGTGPCIEVCGPAATFTNCTFTVNGEKSNGFGTTAIAASWSGTAEINGGTYSAPNGYGVYVYNSGGKITIKDGTVSGGIAAVKANKNVQTGNDSTQPSTVIVEGGCTEGEWQTDDAENAPLVASGGKHTADITDYLAEGLSTAQDEAGNYVVGSKETDAVAEINNESYLTLASAFEAAKADNVTVKLLQNVELQDSISISGRNVTLDLNGRTISGSVSTKNGSGLIEIASGAVVIITDESTGGTKGTIRNYGRTNCKAVFVASGANLTLNGGVNLVIEATGTSAPHVLHVQAGSNRPTVTINDANLVAKGQASTNAFAVGFTATNKNATININGGTFKIEAKDATGNFTIDGSNTNKVITNINGGTFYNWIPGTNGGMVADGHCIVVNSDNSVTVQANAPEDYAAKATGITSGKEVYLVPDGNLYNLLNRAEIDIGLSHTDGTVKIVKNVTCTYPESDAYYGNPSEATIYTLTLDIAEDATLFGMLPLYVADVVVTGSGTVEDNSIVPANDTYEVTTVSNGDTTTYQARIKAENIIASVVLANGTVYNYTNLHSAVTSASSSANAGSTLVLRQDVETDDQSNIDGNLKIDLNGHTYAYTGSGSSGSAFHLNKKDISLEIVDNSEAGGGALSAASAPCAISNYDTRDDVHVTIGAGVTVKGAVGLFGERPILDVYGTIDARGLTYDQDGIWSTYGIVTNGSTTENSVINLHSGAEVYADGHAIYHPSTGTLNVYEGATVEGGSVGIEMRAGTLNVYEGATISGGTGVPASASNGSGTTSVNAAVAVAQHTTKQPVAVNVEGGTLTGGAAIYQTNPEDNPESDVATVTLELTGGTFNGEVYSEDKTGFISGGTYSEDLSEDESKATYLAPDKDTYRRAGGMYSVGDVTQEGQTPSLEPTPGYTWVEDEEGNFSEQLIYVPSVPTTQYPTIEADSNTTVTLTNYGRTATITVADGYELADVTVNGVSRGAVTTLTGLRTGDVVVITTQPIDADTDDNAALIEQIQSTKLIARSQMSSAKGKKAVKVYWFDSAGLDLDFDGYEIYRSLKRYSGFGTKPIFTTEKETYHNTLIRTGIKYYYKVRGYMLIDGEKVYTSWSTKAWRTVK